MDERPVEVVQDSALETRCKHLQIPPQPAQILALLNIVMGKDVLVSLPIGSGKTLCYAIVPVGKIYRCVIMITGP